MDKYYAEDFITPKELLSMQRAFDGVIKYKTRYRGYVVYRPFLNKSRAIGYPRYFLVKRHELCATYYNEKEYHEIECFLEAHGNEIEEKYEVGVNVFLDDD